jgi:hypothetical protein
MVATTPWLSIETDVTVVVASSTTLCDTHIRCEHNMRTFNHIMVKLIEFCMIPACQYIISFGCSYIKFYKNFFVGIKFALHMMSLIICYDIFSVWTWNRHGCIYMVWKHIIVNEAPRRVHYRRLLAA